MNKRIISLFLAILLTFSLVACQTKTNEADKKVEESTTETSKSGNFEATEKGYGGDVTVKVSVKDNEIKGIDADFENETPTIGGDAIKALIDKAVSTNTTALDVVAGATISSEAFIKALNLALENGGVDPKSLVAKELAKVDVKLDYEADIVVVGAGGAGLSAAIKAAEAGKSVIVVEKAANNGGNSNRATGGMNAADTHYQKEQDIEDTVEQFIADTMKGGKDLNNPELVKVMAENSSKAIDWLDSIGAKLSNVGLAGGATNKRSHRPVDESGKIISVGTFLVEKLTQRANDLGVQFIYNARVNEVLFDGERVTGVTAETSDGKLTVMAKAVIVATGGFGGSDKMVSTYRPDLQGYVSTNAPTIEGDAIEFLGKINASFIDMDKIQTHPTVVQKDGSLISESLRGDGAILINKEGVRFVDEVQTRDFVSNAINEQTDKTAWLVVDEKMFEESKVISKYVDKGLLTKAENFEEIAKIIGADASVVETTINTWSSYVNEGEDKDFAHKNLDALASNLENGPYYVGPVGPGIHHTMGGVEINVNAEVIGTDQAPIKGLFAAGEVTGGVHGANRLGGNAVTDIIVFGNIAGENAVKFVDEN